MPPHVPRKRLRKTPPTDDSEIQTERNDKVHAIRVNRRKPTLYDDLDGTATPHTTKESSSTLFDLTIDDSDSSLSSLSDDKFEDVPIAKRQKLIRRESGDDDDDDDDDEDEDIEFEDVEAPITPIADAPVISGDLELTLTKDDRISLITPFGEKKGPTKRERKVRNATHCVHVLCLLWHNALRNAWLCDPEIQATMISHIPPRLWEGVERWRRNSGLAKDTPTSTTKMAGKSKSSSRKKESDMSRDWGYAAKKLEEGVIDMSHGDPLFRLMQPLVSWWKQRFRITSPGIRKWGYMSLERLDRLIKSHAAAEGQYEEFGEKIFNRAELLQCAQTCQGSRDVGAQLFTALLRGLGFEARLVANLQCLGFGWSKYEDAEPETEKKVEPTTNTPEQQTPQKATKKSKARHTPNGATNQTRGSKSYSHRQTNSRAKPILIDDSDNLQLEYRDSDDESVVEWQITPKKQPGKTAKFDKGLEFPHYWTEVLSPVTGKYLPVDAVVKGVIATNRELIESFEPRGAKAEKARQVMAYIVGFSQDGSAKDVTVRYLKKQMMPGRTKGTRWPVTKIPIYNRHGKLKGYEHSDWLKSAMSGYRRGVKSHPVTEADEHEDSTDLKPVKPEKKEIKEGEETLQYYKQSKEFVLERHLKREEALRHGAKPVKVFKVKGKGNKAEEEDVYLRADVVPLKSAETWHKQGRAPLPGVEPLKRVPYRAATTNRRREIVEAEAATGQKVLQGLYSFEQTDWIIPPPIKDGIIPKNEYGNIDLFMEHMCPEGAVHVPFRGAVRVCKRLQIDFAEAVVDFEFGHRMAVPVIQGVVVAEEYHDQVMEELQKDEAERTRKEDEKRRKNALGMWRKMLMGMRIVERIRQDYGEIGDDVSVFGRGSAAAQLNKPPSSRVDEDMAGGFLPEGYEMDEDGPEQAQQTSSYFPTGDDEDEDEDGDDALILEDSRNDHEDDDGDVEQSPPPRRGSKKAKAISSTPRQAVSRRQSARSRRKTLSDEEDDIAEEEIEGDGA